MARPHVLPVEYDGPNDPEHTVYRDDSIYPADESEDEQMPGLEDIDIEDVDVAMQAPMDVQPANRAVRATANSLMTEAPGFVRCELLLFRKRTTDPR